jgi:octaprenyl-diphosphate synthase
MSMQRLQELVKHDFEAMNALIIDRIHRQTGLIDDLASHIIQSGGKRLRPLLVLLASLACGYQGEKHITLAAMVEFFHTATLLHDDVIDESKLRRGRETANAIWGDKISILVGDFLFTQYVQMMIYLGHENIMKLLTDTAYKLTCGELKQLENRHKHEVNEQEYFDIIRGKTSLLFAASACAGAMISHAHNAIETALYNYGLHLGNAFQLIDDVLDYCDDVDIIGKNVGGDLAHGISTLPIIYALKHASPTQQTAIRETLTHGALNNLPEILQAIEDTKAIEYTKQVAANEVNQAIQALSPLPESAYKSALIDLAHYAYSRDH